MSFYLDAIARRIEELTGLPVVRPASVALPDGIYIQLKLRSGLRTENKRFDRYSTTDYHMPDKSYDITIELRGTGTDNYFEEEIGKYSDLCSDLFLTSLKIPFSYTFMPKELFNIPSLAGDSAGQISSLKVVGLLDDYNSSDNKYLYWELEKDETDITLTFYRDSDKTIPVLKGTIDENETSMELSGCFTYDSDEENHIFDSKLTATCEINYTADDMDSANILTVENFYKPPKADAGFGMMILFNGSQGNTGITNANRGKNEFMFSQEFYGQTIIHKSYTEVN